MNLLILSIRSALKACPAAIPHLRAGDPVLDFVKGTLQPAPEVKTYDYFLRELTRMVRNVYAGNLGGEFITIMGNLLQGQITQAFERAWADEGDEGAMPDYMQQAADNLTLDQFDYVDQFYRDIVDARVDELPIDALLARTELWAQRFEEAYNDGIHLIALETGGKEEWVLGETEEHCPTCAGLNGIVAWAREWEETGVEPQNAKNEMLACGGWRCDCRRQPTDKRRTPNAVQRIMDVVESTKNG